jgi:hypothetical protein
MSLVSCCARIVNQNKWPTLLHDRADITVGFYNLKYFVVFLIWQYFTLLLIIWTGIYFLNTFLWQKRINSQLCNISVNVSITDSSAFSKPTSEHNAQTATFRAFRDDVAWRSDSNDILRCGSRCLLILILTTVLHVMIKLEYKRMEIWASITVHHCCFHIR